MQCNSIQFSLHQQPQIYIIKFITIYYVRGSAGLCLGVFMSVPAVFFWVPFQTNGATKEAPQTLTHCIHLCKKIGKKVPQRRTGGIFKIFCAQMEAMWAAMTIGKGKVSDDEFAASSLATTLLDVPGTGSP